LLKIYLLYIKNLYYLIYLLYYLFNKYSISYNIILSI